MFSKKIKESDYTFVENLEEDAYGVKLKGKKWKGVVVVYGKVSVRENTELDIATLSFSYDIKDPGKFDKEALDNNPQFKNYLGDILTHIIQDDVEKELAK